MSDQLDKVREALPADYCVVPAVNPKLVRVQAEVADMATHKIVRDRLKDAGVETKFLLARGGHVPPDGATGDEWKCESCGREVTKRG